MNVDIYSIGFVFVTIWLRIVGGATGTRASNQKWPLGGLSNLFIFISAVEAFLKNRHIFCDQKWSHFCLFSMSTFRPICPLSPYLLPEKCKTKARKINHKVMDLGTRQHTGTCPISRSKMAPNFANGNFLGYAFDVLCMSITEAEECPLIFFTNLNV